MTDRPTKKERRELAKHMHAQASRKARGRAVRTKVIRLAVTLGLVALVGFMLVNNIQASSKRIERINAVGAELGCSGSIDADDPANLIQFPSLGEAHIPPSEPIDYPRLPPESGDHRAGPGPTGIHTDPLDVAVQTHNLEHGHVALNYRQDVPAEIRESLESVASSDTRWYISAPLEEFTGDNAVSLVAWQYRVDCPMLDASQADDLRQLARDFADARKDRAPTESVPGVPIRDDEDAELDDM